MIDEEALRRRAREALQVGRLPNARPERMRGGNGFGMTCAICDAPIAQDEVGYELEFAAESDSLRELHAHARCFAVWQSERTRQPL